MMIKRLFLACALAGLMVLGLTVLVARADGPVIDLDQGDEDFRIIGEDALDWLGEITTGDINADGIPDLIIGASGYDVTGTSRITNAGAVYVIFGASDLTGTLDLNGSGGEADIIVYGVVEDGYAGHTVASGDVTGDNYDDIIVGADWVSHTGRIQVGAIYVVPGPITQTLAEPVWLSDTSRVTLTIYGDNAYDRFGRAVATGDVNGDTIDDLIVGAYQADGPHGSDTGKAYVFYGGASLNGTLDMGTDTADVEIIGTDAYDRLGRSLTTGDVDGDGIEDLVIGAYQSGAGVPPGAGEVILIYGSDSISPTIDLHDHNLVQSGLGLRFRGLEVASGAGFYVAVGNINGDENPGTGVGYGDLLVGAYLEGQNEDGKGYAIYGGPTITTGATITPGTWTIPISDCVDVVLNPADAQDRLGRSVSSGDLNDDGYDDFIIGASRGDPDSGRIDAGETYVFYGGENLSSTITISPTSNTDMTVLGDDADDEAGRSSAAGDVNGDGVDDLIVGAVRAASELGEVYVIWGPKAVSITVESSVDVITTGESVSFTVTAWNAYGQSWDVTTYTTTFDIATAAGGIWAQNTYTTEITGSWVVTATHKELTATTMITVTPVSAVDITLAPASATQEAGQDVVYTVVATDTYGNSWDASAEAAYAISPGANGTWTVNTYTTEIAGTWTVTATVDGVDDTAELTVIHASADSVSLAPASATLEAGQDIAYTVVATDTYGNGWDATSEAAYAISPGAGGTWTVNTYTTEIAGTWTVTATVDGVDDTAELTVIHANADSVLLTPASATLEAGQDIAYTVVATDAYGNGWDATAEAAYAVSPGAGGTWTTNVYTAELAGTWTVTGTADGVDDTAELTVTHASAYSVSLAPATATREAGQDVTYTATAMDVYGNSWDVTAEATYTITLGAYGVWTNNVYTTEVADVWTVTGTADGVDGTATLTVTPASAVDVTLAPAVATREAGQSIAYTVVATDTYGNSWDATAETAYVVSPGAGGVWMTNVYTTEVAGVWAVTGTVDGVNDTAALTVTHASPSRVDLMPDSETLVAGETVTYTLTAYDVYENPWDVTADGTYTIALAAGGSWNGNIYTTGIAGTWTVTGTYSGEHSTATLVVVNVGTLDHIVIEDAAGGTGSAVTAHSMVVNTQITVWAVGYDVSGNYVGDVSVTWSGTGVVAGQLSPTSGISTTFTAATAGTGTIHADDGQDRTADTGTITVTEFQIFLPMVARGA